MSFGQRKTAGGAGGLSGLSKRCFVYARSFFQPPVRGKNQKLVKKKRAKTMAANVARTAMLAAMQRRAMLSATLAWAGAPNVMAKAPELDPHALRTLHERIHAAIAAKRLPGAVLWVERLGAVAHKAVFGQRAWEPVLDVLALDAVFDVASLTKPVVTGVLCTRLIEQGLLRLDESVAALFKDFAGGAAITWRHVITHSSGLLPILPLTPMWSGAAAAHALALAARATQAPGMRFVYSDINYILLGAMIERLAGAPLHELAEREIFQPLAMTDSGYLPLRQHAASRLVPTEFDGATMLRGVVHDPAARRMGGVAAHAGLFSTAADLARFARWVLGAGEVDDAQVLSRQGVALMTANAAPAGLAQRGIGWDIDSPYSRPRGSHYPLGSFGHTGFTGCAMWIDPRSRSFYVFLSNRVHPRVGAAIVDLYAEVGTWAARAAGVMAQ
jgi:CubicO group peptidase (beta-lactamase class C family)